MTFIPMRMGSRRPGLPQSILVALTLAFQSGSCFAAIQYWLPDSADTMPANVQPRAAVFHGDNAAQADPQAWRTSWSNQQAPDVWNDEALRLVVKYRMNPLRASRMLTYLHVAMLDAAMRAEALKLQRAGRTAAAHAAAATMLGHFFPLETPGRLEALGESALATLAADKKPDLAKDIATGAGLGRGIARLAILRALDDRADEVWDARNRPAMRPGMWRGAPPLDSAQPQEALAGEWRTWILKDGAEIQPPAPPAAGSEIFLQAAREVLEVGRNLTPKQKRIADDWHLDQGTVTPPGVWNRKARELAERGKLEEKDRLRMLALLNIAMQDASIACWRAKYTWWLQRPVTTIRDNLDKDFVPYLVTPPHPSYVSGHATVSGAASEVLKRFFPKDAREIDAWAKEAAMSRLYGGIHYRFDNEAGLALGQRIGRTVIERAVSLEKKKM